MRRTARLVLAAIFLLMLGADVFAPHSYRQQFREETAAAPSRAHPLGTDAVGRDRWSRLLHGGRISILLAPAAALLSVVIALAVALGAALLGPWWQRAATAAIDLFLSLPWLFLLLAARGLLPPPTLSVSGAQIIGYDATTATAVLWGSFAASGNFVNVMCSAGGYPSVFNAAVTYQSSSLLYFIYPRIMAPPAPVLCHVRVSVGASSSPWFTLSGFTDLADSDFMAPFVYQVFEQGLIPACATSPFSFCPGSGLTRSDAAAFIIRAAFGENFSYSPSAYFDDVPYWDPSFKYVQKLRDLNITAGCDTRWYCASSLATRSDIAVFVIRAIQARAGKDVNRFGYPATPFFTDVPASDGRFSFVQAMRASGITSGCSPTTYCATSAITRAELAVFLVRGLLNGVTLPDP